MSKITREEVKSAAIIHQIFNEKEASTTANYIDYEQFGFYFTIDGLHEFVNSFTNNQSFKKEFERLGGGERKQELLKQIVGDKE